MDSDQSDGHVDLDLSVKIEVGQEPCGCPASTTGTAGPIQLGSPYEPAGRVTSHQLIRDHTTMEEIGVGDGQLREVDRIEVNLTDLPRPHMLSKELAEKVTKVTFPYFDPEKFKSLSLGLPFPLPESMLNQPSPSVFTTAQEATVSESRPNNQLVLVSHCRKQARVARRQVLFKIGMRSHTSENKKLLAAVQTGDIAKVSGLLNEGVSANVCDQKKRSPLHLAASQGHFAIASLLLAMQANPNRQDILGNTPLHLAVCRGDRHVVHLLIEHGANIHLEDNAGRTPLSIVRARLNTLRSDRSIATDKLKGEFLLMWDFLKYHEGQSSESSSVGDLCHLMANVSTREQADEIADVMINKMSQLQIVNQAKSNNHTIL